MEENTDLKKKVLSGLIWKLMERMGVQGVSFIVQIILVRILLPEDYGVIALITIFIVIANVFVESGLSTALIQKKEADELDFSSVFFLSLFISIVLYIVLFIAAPIIAVFYSEPQLIPVLRVLSITLFFGVLNSVQGAVVSRAIQFKRFFYSSLGGIIASGIIGISMAYMGYGVWALVWQQLSSNLFITGVLWFTVKWRPKLMFSFIRVRKLFAFSWKLVLSSFISTVYNSTYGIIIGKVYNPEMLGYFNRGEMVPKTVASNIDGTFTSVLFPVFSANQDNILRVKSMVRRTISISSFVVFPAMTGLSLCARPIIILILTEKWLQCVPFMQLMCISYALWPINTSGLQVINALGHSDIYLKLSLLRRIVGIAVLAMSIPFGVYVMAALLPFESFICTLINSSQNKKLINYSYKEQLSDIIPSILLSFIMGIIVYFVSLIKVSMIASLTLQISVGVFVYITLAWLFKVDCFIYLISTVKDFIGSHVKRGQTYAL